MYIEPTSEAFVALLRRGLSGPVVMLNLLRFREVADYTGSPELAPSMPISGAEAYQLYAKHALPFLQELGAEVIFQGHGGAHLIGPTEERWDMVLLVRQRSVQDFLSFANNEAYLAVLGHRTASLEDSRLLPLSEFGLEKLSGV